jgi:hypothetical protein
MVAFNNRKNNNRLQMRVVVLSVKLKKEKINLPNSNFFFLFLEDGRVVGAQFLLLSR